MGKRTFLYGPSNKKLQKEAFNIASKNSSHNPQSILWIERNDRRINEISDLWRQNYKPLCLNATTLDRVVRSCYEKINGPSKRLSNQVEKRIGEETIKRLSERNLIKSNAPIDELVGLFSLFEDQNLTTLNKLEKKLNSIPLDENIAEISYKAYIEYKNIRENFLDETVNTRSDEYITFYESSQNFGEFFPSVDFVVFSGYYDLSIIEKLAIKKISKDIQSVATLPLFRTPEDNGYGIDEIALRSVEKFREIGFSFEHVPTEEDNLINSARNMYTQNTLTQNIDSIRWYELSNPYIEVRQIARKIRSQLSENKKDKNKHRNKNKGKSNDISPDDIGVVVPDLDSYTDQIIDIFDSYDIPYSTSRDERLRETYIGDAIFNLIELCRENPTTEHLTGLLTNPIITTENIDYSIDIQKTVEIAHRVQGNSLEDLKRHIGRLDNYSETKEGIEKLLSFTQNIRESNTVNEFIANFRDLIDLVGIDSNRLEEEWIESYAIDLIEEILDSIENTTGIVDYSLSSILTRIERGITEERVRNPPGDSKGRVEVMGLLDARMRSFDHLYLIGLISDEFPKSQERPNFFKDINESDEDLAGAQPDLQAKYVFAGLIADAKNVYITTPETIDDEPTVPSSILTELQRTTKIERKQKLEDRIGSKEDIQREIANRENIIDNIDNIDEDIFSKDTLNLIKKGAICANNRSSPELTKHDGLVDPFTVDSIYPERKREPYSATRVNKYSKCGFKYYASEILDIDPREKIRLEVDKRQKGKYVHETLYTFYSRLQDRPGEPIDLSGYNFEKLKSDLYKAAVDVLEGSEHDYKDLFYDRWLEMLFAGLKDGSDFKMENPHETEEVGLLYRFLEKEYESKSTVKPAWFEAKLHSKSLREEDRKESSMSDTLSRDKTEIDLPSGKKIPIRGKIDRIDIKEEKDSMGVVIYDYKTGNTPSSSDIKSGIEFQLPLYLLGVKKGLQEKTKKDIELLGGSYYQVSPPIDVSYKGQIGSNENAAVGRKTDKGPISVRHSNILYETHDEFVEFLYREIPNRIENITEGIEYGVFIPTILDSGDAGCRYCDFRDICDVRHHMRSDIINEIEDESVYIPDKAKEDWNINVDIDGNVDTNVNSDTNSDSDTGTDTNTDTNTDKNIDINTDKEVERDG